MSLQPKMAMTHCPHCQVDLNIPEAGVGRRLKCPQCGGKFYAGRGGASEAVPKPTTSTRRPHDDEAIPLVPMDLRESFDPPMFHGEPTPQKRSGPPSIADAAALFRSEPTSRRTLAAEARSRERACKTCGGYIPAGMSLCRSCGLDQETGERVDPTDAILEADEDFDPPPSPGLPTGLLLVGSAALATSAGLAALALARTTTAQTQFERIGSLLLLLLCLFGAFAAVLVLRGRSLRPLIVALALGAVVDVATLIALPSWAAAAKPDSLTSAYHERFDFQSVGLGLGFLAIEAIIFIYLMSPRIRRRSEP